MLGLLLIYFIGKNYMKLAEQFAKSKWLFAVLGVISYYVGAFVGGFIVAIIIAYTNPEFIENSSEYVWSFISLPFGIESTIGLYHLLKRSWSKNVQPNIEVLDQ